MISLTLRLWLSQYMWPDCAPVLLILTENSSCRTSICYLERVNWRCQLFEIKLWGMKDIEDGVKGLYSIEGNGRFLKTVNSECMKCIQIKGNYESCMGLSFKIGSSKFTSLQIVLSDGIWIWIDEPAGGDASETMDLSGLIDSVLLLTNLHTGLDWSLCLYWFHLIKYNYNSFTFSETDACEQEVSCIIIVFILRISTKVKKKWTAVNIWTAATLTKPK